MAKYVKYIFICLFAVFVMSHNANAASSTVYLKNGIYAYGIPAITGSQGGTVVNPNTGQQFNLLNNIYVLPANNIWYSMNFYFNNEHTAVDLSDYTDYTFSFSYCSSSSQHFIPTSNDLFRLTDYYEFEADVEKTLRGNLDNDFNITLDQYTTDKCRNVLMKGKVQVSSRNGFQLGTTANGSFSRIFGFDYTYSVGSTIPLYIISPTVVFYTNENEADEALEKERQETQDAADDSSTAGSSSSSDATTATASLISVIGGFVNVITNAQATNCKINMNTTQLQVGEIDLCSNPVPSYVQIIGSLILICAVIPLAIILFNRFISLFRSFQG